MIKIKNWSSYQSYKDRRPPWIRFHKTLLDNYDFQSLSVESRAILPMLWLLASEDKDPTSGLIQVNSQQIAFRLRTTEEIINNCIVELQATDFIECNETVTKPLQHCIDSVPTETEKRQSREETDIGETPLSPSPKADPIPYQKIVDLYHEKLPTLPTVAKLTPKRKGQIRQRFTEDMKDLDNWGHFFDHVADSDFLMGRVQPINGRTPFRADIEWLTNQSNFTKIAEDKYHV